MKKGIDYIGVGVGAAVFDSEGKLFITKRGYWVVCTRPKLYAKEGPAANSEYT